MHHDRIKRRRSQTSSLQTSDLTSAKHRSDGNSRQSMPGLFPGQVPRASAGCSSCSGDTLLNSVNEPPIVLADLACLAECPGPLFIDTAEIILHLCDISFEISPDQIPINLHVFSGLGKERPLRRTAGIHLTCRQSSEDHWQQGYVARTGHVQGKTPLVPLISYVRQVSLLAKQGDLRQIIIIALQSFMLSCIDCGVMNRRSDALKRGRPEEWT